jgi:hypothetical protein
MPNKIQTNRRPDKAQDKKKRQREGRERLSERDEDDVPQESYRDGSVYEEPPPPQRRARRRR